MSVALITGSAGLIGSEAVAYFAKQGFHVVGIDNDMRRRFFGDEASTRPNLERIKRAVPTYEHHDIDIRDETAVLEIFKRYGREISLVIHTAAQPSHDWAARAPLTDFTVNANGTLVLLEATRQKHLVHFLRAFSEVPWVFEEASSFRTLRRSKRRHHFVQLSATEER